MNKQKRQEKMSANDMVLAQKRVEPAKQTGKGIINEGDLYVNCKIDRMAVGNLAQHFRSQRLGAE